MTAKFEAFKAALHALCVEHGVRLRAIGYDDPELSAEDPTDEEPAGIGDLCDYVTGTPEEEAAKAAERKRLELERQEEYERLHLERHREYMEHQELLKARAEVVGVDEAMREHAEALATEYRKTQMRISKDPSDPHYGGPDAREVKVNDRAVPDWAIADEFRRVVIREDGTVVHGSVYIERLPSDKQEAEAPAPVAPVADAGFVGMFVPAPKPEPVLNPPVSAPATASAPVAHKKHGKRK